MDQLKIKKIIEEMTDKEILEAFVKRFECDGAVLVYLDSNSEAGFGRWRNPIGRKWVNNILKRVQSENY